MTAPARSDLRLARLDAPGSPLVARGPAVVVGSAPGPGGLQLAGVRGLGAAHCRLEASGTSAWVSPLGTHQVRMAPHPRVDMAALEPLAGTTPLSRGCVLYLGPVGRGVALPIAGLGLLLLLGLALAALATLAAMIL